MPSALCCAPGLSRELTFPQCAAASGKVSTLYSFAADDYITDMPTARFYYALSSAGILRVQHLQLKASIVDSADLPFTCTSGKLSSWQGLLLLLCN